MRLSNLDHTNLLISSKLKIISNVHYLWFNGVTISKGVIRECCAAIVHNRKAIILYSKSTRSSKQVEVVHLVLRNIFIDYLHIVIPIRANLFVMESKSMDELVYNSVFKPASSTYNDEKTLNSMSTRHPSQKYPFLQILNQSIPKIGLEYSFGTPLFWVLNSNNTS